MPITVRFTLVGEPNLGCLLERVEIVDAEQTIRDRLTQQLYELDPPPDGVTVERELHLKVPRSLHPRTATRDLRARVGRRN